MKTIVTVLTIILGVVFCWAAIEAVSADCRGMSEGCFWQQGGWFHSYQTLITGILAFAAAVGLLNHEREARREDAEREKTSAEREIRSTLQAIKGQVARMDTSVTVNAHEIVQAAADTALTYCARLSLYPGNAVALADWLTYQINYAAAYAIKMAGSAAPAGPRRQAAQCYIAAMTHYLDDIDRLIEDGSLRLVALVTPDLYERYARYGISEEYANLAPFIVKK